MYGGNLKNRCKLLIDIVKEVRKIWPKNKILGARVTGQDWLKNGSTINDCVYLVKKLKNSQKTLNFSKNSIFQKPQFEVLKIIQNHKKSFFSENLKIIKKDSFSISLFFYFH